MVQFRSYDETTITLSTLAVDSVLKGLMKIDASREQGVRLKKVMATCSRFLPQSGNGPLWVGLANSDLSQAEIAEAIVADPQHGSGVPGQERTMREVMLIWVIPRAHVDGDDASRAQNQNEAMRLRTIPYPWKKSIEGTGLAWWVMNRGGGVLTTGEVVNISSFMMGERLDD